MAFSGSWLEHLVLSGSNHLVREPSVEPEHSPSEASEAVEAFRSHRAERPHITESVDLPAVGGCSGAAGSVRTRGQALSNKAV